MFEIANDPTHQAFTGYQAPHILMVTNHGIHQWDVVPGLPDTGGQNLFVNMFTDTLASLGFRITIANRGGYPHPVTGEMQAGLRYKDARRRILYLEDGTPRFIRKEDMDAHLPRLAEFLWQFLESPAGGHIDMIISHYWDGAKIGMLVRRKFRGPVKHIWVPHSLGTVKKRNMSPETWADLRIDERIAIERELVGELDGVAATSPLIRQALVEDYGVRQPLFLPPCIDPGHFGQRTLPIDPKEGVNRRIEPLDPFEKSAGQLDRRDLPVVEFRQQPRCRQIGQRHGTSICPGRSLRQSAHIVCHCLSSGKQCPVVASHCFLRNSGTRRHRLR